MISTKEIKSSALLTITDTLSVRDSSTYKNEHNILSADVRSYGAFGDGVSDDTDAIELAISRNRGGAILFQEGTFFLEKDLKFPADVQIYIKKGATLKTARGVKLTINGEINAGAYQIFEDETILMGTPNISYVLPQWFHDSINAD